VDISVRGVGLSLDRPVQIGERLSLDVSVGDGQPDLRMTVEVRHVRQDWTMWRAGGLFRNVSADDHARIVHLVEGQTAE
jgi:hypothetical protein